MSAPRTPDAELIAVLRAARARIAADREALVQIHFNAYLQALDDDGAAAVAEYDTLLARIDAALSGVA